ncbi:MAG TPA: glycosyltransferase [Gemmataceae bacterium]|nr:glycosyltransferase [Gemmataceae bacterium]
MQAEAASPSAARHGGSPRFDVVVPVHTPEADVRRCILSLLNAKTAIPFELVVIDDATPFEDTRLLLRELAARGLITLISNGRNLGFVASANRGLVLHQDRDVVLLNADTCVYDFWLDRLAQALDRNERAGTATPLSNAATILSYPFPLVNNGMDLEIGPRALDRLVADLGLSPVEIPTAIGFCMAIRRACIADVGLLNAARFGLGYGEENDFSRRAVRRGWTNLAATNVFVWHREGSSFGARRAALVAAAQAQVEAAHPGYAKLIAEFIGRDPLEPVRERIDLERIRRMPQAKVVRQSKGSDDLFEIAFVWESWCRRTIRMIARSPITLPNLPLVRPGIPIDRLAAILVMAGVERIEIRDRPSAFERRLSKAGACASIPVSRKAPARKGNEIRRSAEVGVGAS